MSSTRQSRRRAIGAVSRVLVALTAIASSLIAAHISPVSANGCPLLNPQTGLYEADSEADLVTIRTVAICLSRSIVQTVNITILGPWTAIGTAAGVGNGPFTGTYDGQGKTITFNTGGAVDGVFLRTDGATIRNLRIDTVDSTLSAQSGWLIQGSSPNTTIENVSSTGAISTNSGGIVGGGNLTNTVISNSSSSGVIGQNAGGIVGNIADRVTVIGSFSSGMIGQGAGGAGGIVGANASRATVTGSYSTGAIQNSGGGIIGVFAGISTVTNSFSTGSTADSDAGGVLGRQPTSSTVTNSFALGVGCGGGLIGGSSNTVTVQTSYTMGSNCSGQGGLFGGYAQNPVVTNSWAKGSIAQGSGGILGRNTSGQSGSVSNSYTTGDHTSIYAGGIYGQMPVIPCCYDGTAILTVTNTYSTGNIGSDGGGIGGFTARGTITNSYSTGSIGPGTAGGIKETTSPAQVVNSASENGAGWNDVHAQAVLLGAPPPGQTLGTAWGQCTPNTPYFLVAFYSLNPCAAAPNYAVTVANGQATPTSFTAPDSTFTLVNEYATATPTFVSLVNGTGSVSLGNTVCTYLLACRLTDFVGTGGSSKANFTVVTPGTVTVKRLDPATGVVTLATLTITAATPAPVASVTPVLTISINTGIGSCGNATSAVSIGYRYLPAAGECTRPGYTFAGWARASSPTVPIDLPLLIDPSDGTPRYFVATSLDLVAIWQPTPPPAPTVSGFGNFFCRQCTAVWLFWRTPTDAPNDITYTVTRDRPGECTRIRFDVWNICVDSGLAPGSTHTYSVTATSAGGTSAATKVTVTLGR